MSLTVLFNQGSGGGATSVAAYNDDATIRKLQRALRLESHDAPPFKKDFTLLQSGSLDNEDIRPRGKGRPPPDGGDWPLKALSSSAALLSFGAFTDDAVVKPARTRAPEEQVPPRRAAISAGAGAFTDDAVLKVHRAPIVEDPLSFSPTKPLASMGALQDDARTLPRPRARDEELWPLSPAKPLFPLAPLQDDSRGFSWRSPRDEDPSPFSPAKPLLPIGALVDDVRTRARPTTQPADDLTFSSPPRSSGWLSDDARAPRVARPRLEDERPAIGIAAVALPSIGWGVDDARAKPWHRSITEDDRPFDLRQIASLTEPGWLQDDQWAKPWKRSIAEDDRPFDVSQAAVLSAFGYAQDDARAPAWRRSRDEDWALPSKTTTTLPSAGSLGEDPQPRRVARAWVEAEATISSPPRSSGWLADDARRPTWSRPTAPQEERPLAALAAGALPSAGWLLDDARAKPWRRPIAEDDRPLDPRQVAVLSEFGYALDDPFVGWRKPAVAAFAVATETFLGVAIRNAQASVIAVVIPSYRPIVVVPNQ